MADITMPQLGETVTEGTITKWFKSVGDEVALDDVLFEVSTEKVDSEVPSPASGYLAEILVGEGDTADVGTRLAVVSDSPPDAGSGPAEATGAADAGEASEPDADEETDGPAEVERQTDAGEPAAAGGEDPRGEDRGGRPPGAPSESREGGGSNRLASPLVRRLISERGLDASDIEGTGAGGRITRNDVLGVVEGSGRDSGEPPSPRPPEAPSATATPTVPASAGRGDEVVPFTNIRRRTAEHMIRSLATSAHTLVVVDADFHNVDRVRSGVRARFKQEEGVSLSYLPFVSRAVIDAIREFPRVNSSVGDDELIVHQEIHLGIAVDLNLEGLMVPVVHAADGKRLRALTREIADLAARARERKLGPDDISGGTFTITNPGPFGTLLTAAVINQPQVAILATDGVRKRPVVVETADGDDAVAIHPVGNLALSFDHRAIDGAYASAFVVKVKEIIETRDWSSEL